MSDHYQCDDKHTTPEMFCFVQHDKMMSKSLLGTVGADSGLATLGFGLGALGSRFDVCSSLGRALVFLTAFLDS